jgi:hypothetical protein
MVRVGICLEEGNGWGSRCARCRNCVKGCACRGGCVPRFQNSRSRGAGLLPPIRPIQTSPLHTRYPHIVIQILEDAQTIKHVQSSPLILSTNTHDIIAKIRLNDCATERSTPAAMAPPHTSKKTSSTTSQTNSRRGARQVQQRRVENYEEQTFADHNDADDLNVDDAEAEELIEDIMTEASQDTSQSNPVQQLLRDMQADVCSAQSDHNSTIQLQTTPNPFKVY